MAEQPEGQDCRGCMYYRKDALIFSPTEARGLCRRNPPSMNGGAYGFGVTEDHWWCGEFLPANPQTIEQGAAVIARLYLMGDKTAAYSFLDKLQENRTDETS